jgi:hypothetical protein
MYVKKGMMQNKGDVRIWIRKVLLGKYFFYQCMQTADMKVYKYLYTIMGEGLL